MSTPLHQRIQAAPWYFWVCAFALIVGLVVGVADVFSWFSDDEERRGSETVAVSHQVTTPPGVPQGWGPDRPTFTLEEPASYAALNSITNAVNYGDERNWVTARVLGQDPEAAFGDEFDVKPGDRVTVRFYYANSAADSFDESQPSWVQGLRLKVKFDEGPQERLVVQGRLVADNAVSVWDTATLVAEEPVVLRPVSGSAILENGRETGIPVDDKNLFGENGTLLGYETLDGVLPPSYDYSGTVFVEFEVVAG